MHIERAAKNLAGAVLVYVVVAACGSKQAAAPFGAPSDAGFADGHSETGSGSSGDENSDGSSILDAIANPVPDAKADPDTSGTRLKARRYVGSDGSSQFVGWRDTKRNEDCSFLRHADGSLRCMPAGAFASSFYADAQCTIPVAALALASGCPQPIYVVSYATFATCGYDLVYRIYSVAGTLNGTLYARPSATTCTSTTAPTGFSLYAAGAEMPSTEFVEASVKVD